MTDSAVGLQTTIAARIEAKCEPGAILISDASWQLVRDRIKCNPRGEIQIKGVHDPVNICQPAT